MKTRIYKNPVIAGFYPDPSVCRVKDTFYLVCSSFQFFPGVPLFESKDLLNWKQIGHVLTREKQLPLEGAGCNGGIYAPTIRYNQGRFYMVTTNVSGCGNFYVWTDDIYGEWSDPIPLTGDGIDPSFYFEDNRCYFMRNHSDENGVASILQYEINPATGERIGEEKAIWFGTGGRYLEAPHLYRINDKYYIVAAEGGTEYGHMVVYAKGEDKFGPFENAPENPVLTNRNLGGYPLQGVGHGDLVDDVNGNWWLVHLAFRQISTYEMYHHLGREVCLVPITFHENGSFTAGEAGVSRLEMKTDRISDRVQQTGLQELTFLNSEIGKEWCYLRNPQLENYHWGENTLTLIGTDKSLDEKKASVTFLGTRQRAMKGELDVEVVVKQGEGGVSLYMNEEGHYDLAVEKLTQGMGVFLRKRVGDMVVEIGKYILKEAVPVQLRIDMDSLQYCFTVKTDKAEYVLGTAQTKYLSSEVIGGFTGVMIGLYTQKSGEAVFTNFHYKMEDA